MNTPSIDYDSIAQLYDSYVRTDYDVAFFVTQTAHVKGDVLELGAGTGRLSLPLVESGVKLTCVDMSQGMLYELAAKLTQRGQRAVIHRADVCALQLPPSFELALFPFQSFMEILGVERQRQALAAIRACLKPGGKFICTLHNPAVRRLQIDGSLRLVGQFPIPEGTLVVSGFEQGGHPEVTRLQFFESFDQEGRLLSKQLLPMRFTMVERPEFETLLTAAGFRVLDLYGNYDSSPFDPGRSPVMIWVAQRND